MSGMNRAAAREPRWTFGKLVIRISSWIPAAILAMLTAHNLYERIMLDSQFLPMIRILVLVGAWITYSLGIGWSRRVMPFMLMMCIPMAVALTNNWQFDPMKALLILFAMAVTLVIIRQLSNAMMTFAVIMASVLAFGLSVSDAFAPAFMAREGTLTWVLALMLCWLSASAVLEVIERLVEAGVKPKRAGA